MKKFVAFMLALASLVLMVSCVNTPVESSSTATSPSDTDTSSTTETTASTSRSSEGTTSSNTTATTETSESTTETTVTEPLVLPDDAITSYYGDYFTTLIKNTYYEEKKPFIDFAERDGRYGAMIFFRVEAKLPGDGSLYTRYYFTYQDVIGYERLYGKAPVYDKQMIHMTAHRGTETDQAYAIKPWKVGEVYMFLNSMTHGSFDQTQFLQPTDVFKIVTDDEGKRWVYSTNRDLSIMECAVKITDPEENSVYKVGEDDKIIAYLTENNMILPTYDYKCELEAFYEEYTRRCVAGE